jgi:hypothetical protein
MKYLRSFNESESVDDASKKYRYNIIYDLIDMLYDLSDEGYVVSGPYYIRHISLVKTTIDSGGESMFPFDDVFDVIQRINDYLMDIGIKCSYEVDETVGRYEGSHINLDIRDLSKFKGTNINYIIIKFNI